MIRAFQWDLARQVERLDWLLAQLPRYAAWGYQELHLHLEDAVDYPSLPGVARRDAYTWRQFGKLVDAATRVGIRVVPIVNLLGHTQYLIKTPDWRDLNELRADDGTALPAGQICPSDPRTLEVARRLIADVAPFCTAGKVHVGLDESFHLGKHPASRPAIESIGLARYFARYVEQLHALAAGHGLRTAIWADMLVLLPEAIEHLPRGLIAYDWYYYAFGRLPRFELHNFREYDLEPALRKQGIDYWGCPMNGAFRFEPMPIFGERLANAQSWWKRCEATNAEGFLVTAWEPYRLAIETTVLVDAAIAGLWLDEGPHDQVALLKCGFERLYGKKHAAERTRISLQCDDRAFSGYARWEVNHRWDSVHGREGSALYAADERVFRRINLSRLPPPLAASVRWRTYLATRDRYVRDAHRKILQARRLFARHRQRDLSHLVTRELQALDQQLLKTGEAKISAEEMWLVSRRSSQSNPNRQILKADRQRLTLIKRWWLRVSRDHGLVASESPLAGRWQLRALIHTTRPNLQAVLVQIAVGENEWVDVIQRYLIEFRTAAARPTAQIHHWLSLPVTEPHPKVRFVLRGFGQFEISDVHCTDGLVEHRPLNLRSQSGPRIQLGSHPDLANPFQLDRANGRAGWTPEWTQQSP